ncbi:hypothetical protein [Caudoviricetes sp.]|nr:hypothetical protein [Caudoviricetes sp.]
MSRATACALIIALQRFSPCTAKKLSAECLIDVTDAREWLYEFESVGIVERIGTTTQTGKSSGRSQILWRWLSHVPDQIVENNSLLRLHGTL